MKKSARPPAHRQWPVGNGEMAKRIRAYDWAATPLGLIETWPQSLKTALDIVLAHEIPAAMTFGHE